MRAAVFFALCVASSANIAADVDAVIQSADVVMFEQKGCPFCAHARADLTKANIPFKQVDINTPLYRGALKDKTGRTSAPSIWVKGRYIGGSSDLTPLLQSGKFQEMLNGADEEQLAAEVLATAPLALDAEDAGAHPSVIQTLKDVVMQQLRAPAAQAQQVIGGGAFVIGAVCLVSGETLLFQLVMAGTFLVATLLMRNEAAASWGAASGSPLSLVTSLEAGLAGALVAFYAYEAIVLCLGAVVGFLLAHSLEKFAVNHVGVDAATFDDTNVAFVWYSIFTLGCWGLVATKKHGKYLGVVTSFFGGALVASSALYFTHAEEKWVDCLERLLHGADASEAAVEAALAHNQTAAVWGEQSSLPFLPGYSNFHLVGYAVWAITFLIGAKLQFKSKASAREFGLDSLDGVVTLE